MARPVDVAKLRLWQQRLRRFEHGNSTVAAFCQAERVSLSCFYHWRQKLAPAHQPGSASRREAPKVAAAAARGKQAFLPVKIVQTATIEIHLPNGARLTVPTGDQATLETAVAAVGRLPRAANTEAMTC